MRVVLDHNVRKRLRRFLVGIEVKTAREMAWAELSNGNLISAAENAAFDVMITADKNLKYQQNLAERKLPIIVLPTNDLQYVAKNSEFIVAALHQATIAASSVYSSGICLGASVHPASHPNPEHPVKVVHYPYPTHTASSYTAASGHPQMLTMRPTHIPASTMQASITLRAIKLVPSSARPSLFGD